jgi:hypothetical protein
MVVVPGRRVFLVFPLLAKGRLRDVRARIRDGRELVGRRWVRFMD